MHTSKQEKNSIKKTIIQKSILQKIINKKNQFINWIIFHPWKTIIILFILFFSIKVVISQLFLDPSTIGKDGFAYMKMANSFIKQGRFTIYGEPSHKYPPLFPIAISIGNIFNNALLNFQITRIFCAFFSTLMILPTFLISKEFLNYKNSFQVVVITSLLSSIFITRIFNILSETLFVILFLFSVYFIFKSMTNDGYKYKILSGFFIGLSFLTRYSAIIFFPSILIIYIFVPLLKNNKKKKFILLKGCKNWFFVSMIGGITILPWLIRNGAIFGFSLTGILGYFNELKSTKTTIATATNTSSPNNLNIIQTFITQLFINHALVIIACGIIFLVLAFWILIYSYKNNKNQILLLSSITFITVELLIILTSIHNANWGWRLHERYIEPTFPLVIILGFIGIVTIKKLKQRLIYMILLIMYPITLFLSNTFGYMGGMTTVSYIAILKNIPLYVEKFTAINLDLQVFNYYKIIIIVILSILFLLFLYLIIMNYSKKTILLISVSLIISSSIISGVGYMARDSYSSNSDINEFGSWCNDRFSGSKKTIFLDESIGEGIYQIGIWIDTPIIKGTWNESDDINNKISFLITPNTYNYTLEYTQNVSSPLGVGIRGRDNWHKTIYIYNIESEIE